MPPQSRSNGVPKSPPKTLRGNNMLQRLQPLTPDSVSVGSSHDGAAPRSVYLRMQHPLTRELSDLSGSYGGGDQSRRSGRSSSVPGLIYDNGSNSSAAAKKGTWSQSYLLSHLPPPVNNTSSRDAARNAVIMNTHSEGGVEIVESVSGAITTSTHDSSAIGGLDLDALAKNSQRIPVFILLMDGQRHSYELMQIWVDRSMDSVREVVQSLQQAVTEGKWKQTYDGLFQMRGNRFTQLIHILQLKKYDVQPYEMLIAKPWSMTAKVTISYATSAVRHLTAVGVIHTAEADKMGRRVFRPKTEESPLLLSRTAKDRLWSPSSSTLTHHHAFQFVTFSPPFEAPPSSPEMYEDDGDSSLGSHFNSVGSHPFHDKLLDTIGPGSPRCIAKTGHLDEKQESSPIPLNTVEEIHSAMSLLDGNFDVTYPTQLPTSRRRGKVGHQLSKLNCCKVRERTDMAIAEADASYNLTAKLKCCNTQDDSNLGTMTGFVPASPAIPLQELQWSAFDDPHQHQPKPESSLSRPPQWRSFDIRPIAEDHSVTGQSMGHSVTAPLLESRSPGLQMGEF